MNIIRQLASILAVAFLSGPAAAGDSALCSDALGWSSATSVRTSSDDTNTSVRIQRHSDGVRIDMNGPGQAKTLIMLETGERMFRGSTSGVEDFGFADIEAGAPIHYLQQRFPTPCDAQRAGTFHIKADGNDPSIAGGGSISGTIHAGSDSLRYTLDFYSDRPPQRVRRIHGEWSVAALLPIPADTAIDGWSLQRDDTGVIEKIQSTTIGDFQKRQTARDGNP